MPLVIAQQARARGWTPWLRTRHDEVLDALFAWSTKNPANKAMFDRAFALLRPAAQDFVSAYQQTQALSGEEAQEATGVAIMELLYGATVSIALRWAVIWMRREVQQAVNRDIRFWPSQAKCLVSGFHGATLTSRLS